MNIPNKTIHTALDIRQLKKQNPEKKLVFTNGCFDLLHAGHIQYLLEAKALGDILVIGLNSDHSVKQIKDKNRPLVSEENRAFCLKALKPVDFVCLFDETTPLSLIKEIKPDIYVKGGDYSIEQLIEKKPVEKYGGQIKILSLRENCSTTTIIQKILSSYK